MPTESGPVRAPSSGEDGQISFLLGVLDRMIALFGSDAHTAAITAARQEYDERRGRVFEDEDLWEPWTQAFLEWYVVERLAGAAPLAARYLSLRTPRPQDDARSLADEHAAVHAWASSHRSLFEVRALRAGRVELLDLLGGGQFSVVEQRAMLGVSAGDVAELRLVGFENNVLFGRTFCFHPAGTREAIVTHARRMTGQGAPRADIVDFCASLRIRCERYRHVPPRRIYEAGTVTFERGSASRDPRRDDPDPRAGAAAASFDARTEPGDREPGDREPGDREPGQ